MKDRTRNWATILYPESAKSNWREILTDLKIPCFISPLHNRDLNPDGSHKKEHYHIIFIFDGVKSREQIQDICCLIGSVGQEYINSIRGYCRYLCHLDNPEKYQYNISDVVSFCGLDYSEFISLNSDIIKVISEMISFCEDNNVCSFYLLSKYAFLYNNNWARALSTSCSVFMREYLQSRSWSLDRKINHIISKDGEILI